MVEMSDLFVPEYFSKCPDSEITTERPLANTTNRWGLTLKHQTEEYHIYLFRENNRYGITIQTYKQIYYMTPDENTERTYITWLYSTSETFIEAYKVLCSLGHHTHIYFDSSKNVLRGYLDGKWMSVEKSGLQYSRQTIPDISIDALPEIESDTQTPFTYKDIQLSPLKLCLNFSNQYFYVYSDYIVFISQFSRRIVQRICFFPFSVDTFITLIIEHLPDEYIDPTDISILYAKNTSVRSTIMSKYI